ncbi:nitrogen fixation protein NifQ [Oceanobacter sp. 3_MG-2023]|uniref:nitrogen fixation protein NifQ n=1 Tax=Oceanobacter sp. 3_MG-2023 TaxID=3062622 RepID=UPI0027368B3B|nr:nitrogen fixation protein NifQ [Oceanobacter sp. 3_MG-2023]MDP2505651.1 nitrogen fixation protein NifQ [Oceanobacter sp. 3_MG-2023]
MTLAVTVKPTLWRQIMTQLLPASTSERESLRTNTSRWLGQILRSQRQGRTCLPYYLGLKPVDYRWFLHRYLYGQNRYQSLPFPQQQDRDNQRHGADLRQQLLEMREDEWLEIRQLLLQHRAGKDDSELLMADMVAAGCLGKEHLWRDLGLLNRGELSALLSQNFPALVAANDRDMKWKRFFYKQLCEAGGGYVCRAPSCDDCTAYAECFGPED